MMCGCMQLADGLTCVLQTAVDGAGPNCIMQMCQQQVNRDFLALFLLGLALCLLAVLGLMRVPQRLASAVRRVHHQAVMVGLHSPELTSAPLHSVFCCSTLLGMPFLYLRGVARGSLLSSIRCDIGHSDG